MCGAGTRPYKVLMLAPDWSLGEYEHTAELLLPAAQAAVDLARIRVGERVVDLGCGTGNAALLAAGPGIDVTGVDPAARLLEVARAEAAHRGLDVAFVRGEAADIPLPTGHADAVLSIFSVIFAPDPHAAAVELARITAPAGRMVIAAWQPGGTLDAISGAAIGAVVEATGTVPLAGPGFAWHDPAAMTGLLEPHGFRVTVHEHELQMTAASPEDYWQHQQLRHPFAVAVAPLLEAHGLVEGVHQKVLAILEQANQDPSALRFPARYVLIEARRAD